MDAVVKAAAGLADRRSRLGARRSRGDLPRGLPGGRRWRLSCSGAASSTALRSLAFWCAGVGRLHRARLRDLPVAEGLRSISTSCSRTIPTRSSSCSGSPGSGSLSSGAGFLDAELFGLMLPILILVHGSRGRGGPVRGRGGCRPARARSSPTRSAAPLPSWRRARLSPLEVVALCRRRRHRDRRRRPDLRARPLASATSRGAIVELALLGLFYGWLALAVGAATGNRARRPRRRRRLCRRRLPRLGPPHPRRLARPVPVPVGFLVARSLAARKRHRGWGALVVGAASAAVLGRRRVSRRAGETSRCRKGLKPAQTRHTFPGTVPEGRLLPHAGGAPWGVDSGADRRSLASDRASDLDMLVVRFGGMEALTVGEAAKRSGWSPRMLRYLEQDGLVVPGRTAAGYRVYGLAELNRLRSLRELRDVHGVGLDELAFAARLRARARAAQGGRRLARGRRRQRFLDRLGAAQARAAPCRMNDPI